MAETSADSVNVEVDPMVRFRKRFAERMTRDVLAKLKPDDKDLEPESNNPYTIGNILWITCSIIVFRVAEVPEAFLYDPRKKHFFFLMGLLLILVNVCICLFCVVWLSFIKRVSSDQWEKLYPSAIPVATLSFVVGSVLLTIGLWPIWRYLTPVILFVMFMGFVVFISMIPNWGSPDKPKKTDEKHQD